MLATKGSSGATPDVARTPTTDGRQLRLILDTARQFGPEVMVVTILVFVEIAMAGPDGIRVSEIEQRLGLGHSAASRNVSMLTFRSWTKKPGFDVVNVLTDPADCRAKLVRLNAKGRRIWASMLRALEV